MKYLLIIFVIAISSTGFAQLIPAGVYDTNKKPDTNGKLTILKGETRFLHTYEFALITLEAKKKEDLFLAMIDEEQVVIVAEGELKILYNKEKKILTRGGVAHILPGDLFSFENAGKTPAKFYL